MSFVEGYSVDERNEGVVPIPITAEYHEVSHVPLKMARAQHVPPGHTQSKAIQITGNREKCVPRVLAQRLTETRIDIHEAGRHKYWVNCTRSGGLTRKGPQC